MRDGSVLNERVSHGTLKHISHIAPGPLQHAARCLQSPHKSIPGNTSSPGLQKDSESLCNAPEGVLNAAEAVLNAARGRAERIC